MTRVFFYGLFMDEGLLREKGLHPAVIGPAKLKDYRIRILERATLIRARGFDAYGLLMDLADVEVQSLYTSPGVSDYRPETVDVVLLEGGSVHTCVCYNLPPDRLGSGANEEYADSLSRLLLDLGFSEGYAAEVRQREG